MDTLCHPLVEHSADAVAMLDATGRMLFASESSAPAARPDDMQPHLFEPFFTTKDPSEGTGPGLGARG